MVGASSWRSLWLDLSLGPRSGKPAPKAKPPVAEPCQHAGALEAAGKLAEAEARYTKALADPKARGCALAALKRFSETAATRATAEADDRCLYADALMKVEQKAEAEKAYLAVLEEHPDEPCATTALTEASALAADERCDSADALKDVGQDSKAEAAYLEVLKAHPNEKCARDGLDELNGFDPADASKSLTDIAVVVAEVLALLLLACLLLIALASRIPWFGHWLGRRKWFRPMLGPRLKVDEFAGTEGQPDVGGGVTALVRNALSRRSTGRSLDLVSDHGDLGTEFKALADISPQLKIAVALLSVTDFLINRKRFTATGQLQRAGDQGAGLTVALQEGRLFGSMWTGWAEPLAIDPADDAEDPEPYHRLSVPAAAWIGHEIGTVLQVPNRVTRDSRSYALFRAGFESHRRLDYAAARDLYNDALSADSHNLAALNNLAVVEAHAFERYDEAVRLLSLARKEMEAQT